MSRFCGSLCTPEYLLVVILRGDPETRPGNSHGHSPMKTCPTRKFSTPKNPLNIFPVKNPPHCQLLLCNFMWL